MSSVNALCPAARHRNKNILIVGRENNLDAFVDFSFIPLCRCRLLNRSGTFLQRGCLSPGTLLLLRLALRAALLRECPQGAAEETEMSADILEFRSEKVQLEKVNTRLG